MSDRPLTSIVVAVFNQLEYTKRCIESLYACTNPSEYELIVVDNGSTDGTAEYLSTLDATVITHSANLGCSRAWNAGIRVAQGDYYCVINNDILFMPNWLPTLRAFAEAHPEFGAVSPWVMHRDAADPDVNFAQTAEQFIEKHRDDVHDGLQGPCMLIPRSTTERVGLFDEAYFVLWEDVDYLMRIQQHGLKCGITLSTAVFHFGARTQSLVSDYDKSLSREVFIRKWNVNLNRPWTVNNSRLIFLDEEQ